MPVFRLTVFFIAGCVVASACGERVEEQEALAEEPVLLLPDEEEEPMPAESLPMPDIPEPRRGHLVGRMTGQVLDILAGAWKAEARVCENPPMLEVLAREPGVGTLVVLQLPQAGSRLVDYPVMVVEHGVPPGPASQIGVQLFSRSDISAFQATGGVVSVYELDDRISGRFTVTLRMVGTDDRQKYAGIFEDVPVEVLPSETCQRLQDAMQPPDSVLNDSLPR